MTNFKKLQDQANKGNAEAQYLLGIHMFKRKTAEDRYQAELWLTRSAQQGYIKAQIELIDNVDLPIDLKTRLKWINLIIENKSNISACNMTSEYCRSWLSKIRKPKFRDLSHIADFDSVQWEDDAIKGDKDAQFRLAWFFYEERNFEKATYWFLEAAKNGNIEAKYELGTKWFIQLDDHVKLKWLLSAADHGHVEAMYSIGVKYYNEIDIIQFDDHETSDKKRLNESVMKYFKIASKKGHVPSQYMLGLCYAEKQYPNLYNALYWYKRAAGQGNSLAWEAIGREYISGRFLKKDYLQAISCYIVSANLGNSNALIKLGDFYNERNKTRLAIKWYETASENFTNARESSLKLAEIYYKSRIKDLKRKTMSFAWINICWSMWRYYQDCVHDEFQSGEGQEADYVEDTLCKWDAKLSDNEKDKAREFVVKWFKQFQGFLYPIDYHWEPQLRLEKYGFLQPPNKKTKCKLP